MSNNTLNKLTELEDANPTKTFGPYEEEAIISLAIDYPEFFTAAGRFLKPQLFQRVECQYIMAHILNLYEKYDIVPTRELLKETIDNVLTIDEPYESITKILNRKSNPREVPIIKNTLLKWAKNRAFGLLYSPEAIEAYHLGNYEYIEKIVSEANRIADVGATGFWFLENYQILFEPSIVDHHTTGFPRLDAILNNGGPSLKEVCCFMAGTNVGKSVILCNTAITSLKGMGTNNQPGQDVLLITCELDTIKTAMRCLGVATGIPLKQIYDHKDYIIRIIEKLKENYNKRFFIYEMPPAECSVNHIYALLDNLKKNEGWKPDILIVDYLDLLISRVHEYNNNDYNRQKHVSEELRGLAKNENVLVFTATQTNRLGAKDGEVVDLTKAAESYAKQFSLDYVVGLMQSQADFRHVPPVIKMFVAKNRNGPKNDTISCEINYDTMLVKEQL